MKRKHPEGHDFKNKKTRKATDSKDGSHDGVLQMDILNMVKGLGLDAKQDSKSKAAPDQDATITLKVSELSSTGDGLAHDPESNAIFVVPYAIPQDTVRARVARHTTAQGIRHTFANLVEVLNPSPDRADELIRCKYFANCSGCQLQMMPYEKQLQHKRRVIEKAYQNFSGIDPAQIPEVGDTVPSPLQYGYRTKLTPHFDAPPGKRSDRRKGIVNKFTQVPPIGFMPKNSKNTIDIEDCPIGTQALRQGLKRERQRVANELDSFRRGATILLREHTQREYKNVDNDLSQNPDANVPDGAVQEDFPDHIDYHTCVTDQKGMTTEYVGDFVFRNRAGAFFQNNNSILPVFTQYVRDLVLPKYSPTAGASKAKYLIDAYCGSGLFSITLASMFEKTIGIDIDESSIASAEQNARNNKVPESQATFMAAEARDLFAKVTFPADESVAIVDPPRKGCGEDFLQQLMKFGPARIVYVSCNVHTQARDVTMLVNGADEGAEGMYELESLRGFDFFPQTGHVEGVAVLSRKEFSSFDF